MTQDELFELLGHQDILRDLDVKTLVLDLVRERLDQDELLQLFWSHLPELDEAYVKDYFYRRFY